MKRWWNRLLVGAAICGVLAVGAVGATLAWLHRPLPQGEPGPAAEALAQALVASVDGEAWSRTGAVAWTFAGRRSHLWDRERGYLRLTEGDRVTWLRLDNLDGVAREGDRALTGDARRAALESAWSAFCNDSFWLNPVVKVFDPGTSRKRVPLGDGTYALLVTYSSGGVTPGDSYLWIPGPDGRPAAWRMWVSILPIGGVEATWEGWIRLPTGAWVSTEHAWEVGRMTIVSDVRAAGKLQELEPGVDPFVVLETPP